MKRFPKTKTILALPLFIEGVPRRGEGVFEYCDKNSSVGSAATSSINRGGAGILTVFGNLSI